MVTAVCFTQVQDVFMYMVVTECLTAPATEHPVKRSIMSPRLENGTSCVILVYQGFFIQQSLLIAQWSFLVAEERRNWYRATWWCSTLVSVLLGFLDFSSGISVCIQLVCFNFKCQVCFRVFFIMESFLLIKSQWILLLTTHCENHCVSFWWIFVVFFSVLTKSNVMIVAASFL